MRIVFVAHRIRFESSPRQYEGALENPQVQCDPPWRVRREVQSSSGRVSQGSQNNQDGGIQAFARTYRVFAPGLRQPPPFCREPLL